jgi:hypothetical protein
VGEIDTKKLVEEARSLADGLTPINKDVIEIIRKLAFRIEILLLKLKESEKEIDSLSTQLQGLTG